MKKLQCTTVLPLAGCAAIALLISSCTPNRTPSAKVQPSPQSFPKPIVQGNPAPLPTVQTKKLLPLTQAVARLPEIPTVGDRDPFAAVPPSTALKFSSEPVQPAANPAQPPENPSPSNAPAAVIGPLPKPTLVQPGNTQRSTVPKTLPRTTAINLPAIPAPASITALPPITTAPAPIEIPAPAPSIAESIAITGVLQVGGKLTAIVQEPNASPRYVQAGAPLAGGTVRLKRIVMNRNGEPTIVLEENGKEVIKSLGSTVAQRL